MALFWDQIQNQTNNINKIDDVQTLNWISIKYTIFFVLYNPKTRNILILSNTQSLGYRNTKILIIYKEQNKH
jgi:hypothetical protein